MVNNFCELETLIYKNDFEFVFLSETHLKSIDCDNLIGLKNYNILRVDSLSRHTGGVLIYIKNHWTYEIIKSVAVGVKIWWLVVKVRNSNSVLYLAAIYRAPGYLSSNDDFYGHFNDYIEELNEVNNKIVIAGDFNLDWLVNNNSKNILKGIICDSGLKQIVNDCTRITKDSKSLIDYVVVNDSYNISAKVDNKLKISDHETVVINIKERSRINRENKIIKYVKYNKNKFRSKIVRSDIMTTYFLDCNKKANMFSNSLRNIINDFVITTTIKHNNNCEWFSNELEVLKSEKVRQYRMAIFDNNMNQWSKYKSLRNNYKNKINSAKKRFISNKIDYASDQKSMWRTIKTLVLKESKNELREVDFGNEQCKESSEIANKFNRYFIESVEIVNKSIPMRQYKNCIHSTNSRFKFRLITIEELKSIIKTINNKKDMNLCTIKMISDSMDLIGENLLSIINNSMISGVFPECWKESMVVPIEKVKNTIKCSEFRPINMISIESKILEKVVYSQLEEYFERNRLISENQSGFRKNHSCESLLNLVLTNWKIAVHDRKVIVAVFLDLRRAFETIDRDILLQKLDKYGVCENELDWFKSYLKNRKQRTKVNNSISDAINISLGVPQGTILGVLLFLIYINDLEKAIGESKVLLFADDALLYVVGDSIAECVQKINEDLKRLSNWFEMNKLKLNIEKTKCMVLNANLDNDILIDNVAIDIVDEIKYLGLIIDNKLSFKSHLNYICKKIGKKLYFFSIIRKNLSVMSAIKIFNVMLKPHFEYCASILFTFNAEMMNRLQKLQNRGMRTILKLNRYTSKTFMLEALKWMSVSQKIKMSVLILVYKIKNKMLPTYLTNRLVYVDDIHHHYLRNKSNFRLNFFCNNKTQNMLMYNGLKLYNELPNSLKFEQNFKKFKKALIKYVKETFV